MAKPKYDESTIIVRDKIYVPAETFDAEAAQKTYTHYMYEEKNCARCPNKPMRHNFECDQCPAFKGAVATCNTVYKNGIEYVGLPLGDRLKIEQKLGIDFADYNFIDKRVKKKFDYPVKMRKSFKLRDYQEEAEEDWWQYKHGLIVAPPRSGKTPTMLHLAIRIGYRAILLANQHEFLKQFVDHIEELTNLPHMQERTGKKLYGFPEKIEDFDTLQIAVCTYQQFISATSGKERYARACANFGTLLVDEVHRANSNEFAKVVSRWPSRIRLGVTGTDTRKDCFIAGTPVKLATGHTLPIEDVRIGQTVLSYNHKTKKTETKLVVEIHERPKSASLVRVVHEKGELVCTGDHEIWSNTRQAYVRASELTEEDDLRL